MILATYGPSVFFDRAYLYYFRARCESCSKYTTGANAIAPMDALGEEMEDFDEDLENTPPTKTDPPKVSTHALTVLIPGHFPDNDVIKRLCPGFRNINVIFTDSHEIVPRESY